MDILARFAMQRAARERSVEHYANTHSFRDIETDLSKTAYGHKGHIEIAGMVRMLMRDDLDHEPVVCAARDRIEWLAFKLKEYEELLLAYGHIVDSVTVDPRVRDVLQAYTSMEDIEIRESSDKKWKNLYIDGTVNNKKYQLVLKERLDEQ